MENKETKRYGHVKISLEEYDEYQKLKSKIENLESKAVKFENHVADFLGSFLMEANESRYLDPMEGDAMAISRLLGKFKKSIKIHTVNGIVEVGNGDECLYLNKK